MRNAWTWALPLTVLVPVVFGCGAAPPPGGGQTAAAGAPAGSSAGPAAEAPDAGTQPPPSTTTAVGDTGDAQAAKLPEAHAPEPSDAGPPAKAAHGHDIGRSPQDIRAIIQAHRDEARACYDAALKDHPGIQGDLVMKWTIDPKGQVTEVSVDASRSQISEPSVSSCVGDVIKKIQFAASQGGFETHAFYPFNFHPHHGAGSTPSPTSTPSAP